MSAIFKFQTGAANLLNLETDYYLDCVNRVCSTSEGQGLFWFDQDALVSRKATLVLADAIDEQGSSRFAGGLHITASEDGGCYVQGAVVNPQYRGHGLLKRLAARARLLAGDVRASAVVRVYADDRVNLASLLSLSAVGIGEIHGLGRSTYRGDRFDGHLNATLEPDGRTYRYLTLQGSPSLGLAYQVLAAYAPGDFPA